MFDSSKMSEYSFRNTASRKRSRENAALRASAPHVRERLGRSSSMLRSMYAASQASGATRKNIEEESVQAQCDAILGPAFPGTLCWLCGFPIQGLRERVPETYIYSVYLDSPVCEHVLPVRLAKIITGLYNPYALGPVENTEILHSVYEYAHHLCNMAKSDEYFISKPLDSGDNWCGLVVNEEKIRVYLNNLYRYIRSPLPPQRPIHKGVVDRHESGIFESTVSGYQRRYDNNVQVYVNDAFGTNVERWKSEQFARIREKCQSMVNRLKERDGCETNSPGNYYRASLNALDEITRHGRVLPRFGPKSAIVARTPSFTAEWGGEEAARYPGAGNGSGTQLAVVEEENEENTNESNVLPQNNPRVKRARGTGGKRTTRKHTLKLKSKQSSRRNAKSKRW
jgi:hypothetical protein